MSRDTSISENIAFSHVSPGIAAPNINDLLLLFHSLQDRVYALEDRAVSLEEENAALRLKLASLETLQEEEITRVCVDIATDRRRLAALEQRPLAGSAPPAPRGEKTIARIAKIDEVLKNRGPTSLSQLGHIMEIDRATMTRLLSKLDMRRYELHTRPGDDREKVLRLRAQIR